MSHTLHPIARALLKYKAQLQGEHNVLTGPLLDAPTKELLRTDCNAFLFGLLADQAIRVETAWSLPYKLRERLGHLSVSTIATFPSHETLERAIKKKPALHRFPATIAAYLYQASRTLVAEYQGNAKNIWNTDRAEIVFQRLLAFHGISHKKASLGCLMLARDFNHRFVDTEAIPLVCDVHTRRVMQRTGLSENDSIPKVTAAAMRLYPLYPALLTGPLWAVGSRYCRPTTPDCAHCPLGPHCKKAIE